MKETTLTIKNNLLKILSTWFYSGLAPKAPGTFGSLATLPFVYLLAYWKGWEAVLIFAIIISIVGIWAAEGYAKLVNKKDPGFIVIDETAGQALTLLAAGTNLWLYLIGFGLFRLLDISKPGPIGWADRNIKGGLGIMLDDVIAGVIGGIILYGIRIWCF